MEFNDINDSISWIEKQPKFRLKQSLTHVQRAFDLANINLDNIKKIHVTGTNGKGSTCAFIEQSLIDNNIRVGVFTSPYLMVFNERIRINKIPISDDDLLKLINHIFDLNQTYYELYSEKLSFFELLTIASLIYFSKNNVDCIIMEVGIGGILDATNILNYDCSLITNIGFDHMKQLGSTLHEIASNKLGILKMGNHLISTVDYELYDYFDRYTKHIGASFKYINPNRIRTLIGNPNVFSYNNKSFESSLLGNYQKNNAILAYEAIKYLFPQIDDRSIKGSFANTTWPGRLERLKDNIYIDGAHNMHAIEQLVSTIKSTFKNRNVSVLFSSLSDKEPKKMIDCLKDVVKMMVVTSFVDARFSSLEGYHNTYIDNPEEALSFLLKNSANNDIILITGSIHFIGYMKKIILKAS